MEKKTIGAFLSALRRAHGMTQRELGDRLFVSDKTISRWERDECAPDLSLIPEIADIFGVTADELLRGERKVPTIPEAATSPENNSPKKDARSERQFKRLLDRRLTKYNNLSLASIGLGLLGLIVAAILNLGVLRAYIAFGVSLIFFLGAAICQLCFASTLRMKEDEEDDTDDRRQLLSEFNEQILLKAKNVLWLHFELLAFCLPLTMAGDAYYGLNLESWLGFGLLFAATGLIVWHSVYVFFVRSLLTRRGLLSDTNTTGSQRRLLGRTLGLCLVVGIAALLCVGVVQSLDTEVFVKPYVFDNQEDFIEFMATKDPGDEEDGIFVNVESIPVAPYNPETEQDEDIKEEFRDDEHLRDYVCDKNGEVLFSYINRRGSVWITLSDTPDRFPISVLTLPLIRRANAIQNTISVSLGLAYAAFCVVMAIRYIQKRQSLSA